MLLCVDGLKYTRANPARIWAALRMCVGVGARVSVGRGKGKRAREGTGKKLGTFKEMRNANCYTK